MSTEKKARIKLNIAHRQIIELSDPQVITEQKPQPDPEFVYAKPLIIEQLTNKKTRKPDGSKKS